MKKIKMTEIDDFVKRGIENIRLTHLDEDFKRIKALSYGYVKEVQINGVKLNLSDFGETKEIEHDWESDYCDPDDTYRVFEISLPCDKGMKKYGIEELQYWHIAYHISHVTRAGTDSCIYFAEEKKNVTN